MQNSNLEAIRGIETLGGRIKKLRELKGWSQRELAYRVNLSSAGICKIENNKTSQTRKIVAFSRVFDVEPQILDTYDCKENQEIAYVQQMKKMFPNWKDIFWNELKKS